MKCSFCKKKTHMPLDCKSCFLSLCLKCYAPEKHTCEKIDVYLHKLKSELKEQIQSNSCKSDKLSSRI